ncbi:MAG: RsmB/NOP family class I SAM-dependent RNA methyltransferase [Oscillospiraceae bacterium]|nr:RsmB/NOP family class I SAM-dependent RNA methyltransferase [Oscillospiraceae bacterium]
MLPEGFSQRMLRLLGEEYEEFLASYERPRNTGLRLNPLKAAPLSLPFCSGTIPWEENGFYLKEGSRPGLHPYHDAGLYYLQEPSAMAPARLLSPEPGERVLDLCAAPGGKSTQLGAMLQGEGLLVCNEIHPKRARILSSNIERMGIANALVLNEHPAKLAERFPAYFDRILVDAPCSGEGMFRKEDAAVSDWSVETVTMCAGRQKEILHSAAQMLRHGGVLVYSTCTFSPEENEGVISGFLKAHPDFSVESISLPYFDRGRPEWTDEPAPHLEHCFRLWPHKLKGEGHFAARLRRDGDSCGAALPLQKAAMLPKEVKEFLHSNHIAPSGCPVIFGETVYLAPEGLPALAGLKVLRAGLELGELRKGRFVPGHALALWLKDFPSKADFPADSPEINAYLHGQTLFGEQKDWTLICCDGYSLGWVKGSGGILKNHYPKGLRRL